MAPSAAASLRNLAPPETPLAQRQRSILADFLAAVEPDHAEDIADSLFREFKTLGRIWSASPEALSRILGHESRIGNLLLKARDAMSAASQCDLRSSAVNIHDPALGHYLMTSMGSLGEEVLRVLFLDGRERLIADEQMQWGGLSQVALHPRTIFRRAMELAAAGIIIVHNHPSGDARPSDSDIEITERLRSIGQPLEIAIVGHIVVASSGWQLVPISSKTSAQRHVDVELKLRDVSNIASDLATIEQMAFANALSTIRRRELRRSFIGNREFFGEPAWDMLVDLFVHDCAGKPVSTSSLCIASGVPTTTALRLLHRLCEAGLVLRRRDAHDGRVQLVELTSNIRRKLLAYFAAVSIEEK